MGQWTDDLIATRKMEIMGKKNYLATGYYIETLFGLSIQHDIKNLIFIS
jgi:hypothetical protein